MWHGDSWEYSDSDEPAVSNLKNVCFSKVSWLVLLEYFCLC